MIQLDWTNGLVSNNQAYCNLFVVWFRCTNLKVAIQTFVCLKKRVFFKHIFLVVLTFVSIFQVMFFL